MSIRLNPADMAARLLIGLLGTAFLLPTNTARGDEGPPVASFQAAPPGTGETPADAAPPSSGEPKLSFNFRFAPWPDVLKLFAETAGLTLDLKDTPPGTFDYFDSTKYTPTQALDVLNGYLLPRGYLLVRRNRFLVCFNINQGIPPNVVPKVSPEELANRGDNELVTVVFQLEGDNAEQAAVEVQQLLGPQGKAVALRASNSLLVTDVGSNLRLVDGLLKRGAGRPRTGGPQDTEFRAFPLQYISAREAERMVRNLFGLANSTDSAGADSPAPAGRRGPSDGGMQLTAEERINSLLVKAPTQDIRLIEQLLQATDVETSAGTGPAGAGRFRTTVEVVPLGGADAARIGRALGSLTPRIRVSTTGTPKSPAGSAQGPPAPTAGNGGDPARQPSSPDNDGQQADPNGR